MLNSKIVGARIADARKKRNLSQAALAEKIAISPQAVGKWERGESLPDVTVLHRLGEIFGLDLNYFSGEETADHPEHDLKFQVVSKLRRKRESEGSWDMSQGNWVDSDFSGLKNLSGQFNSSNMKNCAVRDSDLSGLVLANNNIEQCDFTDSDLRDSTFRSSNISGNQFIACSLIDAQFVKCNVGVSDFTRANLSGSNFLDTNFEKNCCEEVNWNFASFKRSNLSEITFGGEIEDCQFESCGFYKVQFVNCTLRNTYFKNNKRFKKVEFVNCKVDRITFAFLKNNQANLEGIEILD